MIPMILSPTRYEIGVSSRELYRAHSISFSKSPISQTVFESPPAVAGMSSWPEILYWCSLKIVS